MRVLVYGLNATIVGGIELYLLNMNGNFGDELKFDYIVEGETCVFKERIDSLKEKVYFIPHKKKHPIKSILKYIKILKSNKKLYNKIYFNLTSLHYFFPILIGKLLGYKIIIHSHNVKSDKKVSIYNLLHCTARKMLWTIKPLMLACSIPAAEWMYGKRAVKKNKAKVINNAIEVEKFGFSETIRKKVRSKYYITNEFVIGNVARIAYQKNPEYLIKIFREIHKVNRNSKLMMVGDGDLREYVEWLAYIYGLKENIIILGNQKNVNELLQAMDIFLLPTRYEGLGISLIEAQTAGLPCFTSANVVPKETKVSDLLTYIPLAKTPSEWADVCLKTCKKYSRRSYIEEVRRAGFDIRIEAKVLERLLTSSN